MNLEYLRLRCPEHVENLVSMGAFNQARAAIKNHMALEISPILRERLEHELLTMDLIERDFIYTRSDLFGALSPHITGLDLAEIETFEDEGYLLWHMIEGEKKYHKRAVKTVLKENLSIEKRLNLEGYEPAQIYLKEYKALDLAIEKIRLTGELSVEMILETGLKIKPEVLKRCEDEIISRFYLPFPRRAHFTRQVELLETSSSNYQIASENALQRVVYFESNHGEDAFKMKYKFLNHMIYRPLYEIAEALEPKSEQTYSAPVNLYGTLDQVAQERFLKEKSPHILFTPLLVDLAQQIVKEETNPLVKAKRIYDYITQHIRYRFMGSYRMLLNIPEYGALNMRGDCGVQSLLFITLLRIVGVPATFASGLTTVPEGGAGMHDWSAFYVEPYGWCFADASYGESAYRRGLVAKRRFYFGNLDPYRMMSNFDFQESFEFPKAFMRDDPYDNQVGEVETNSGSLFSDDYSENIELIAVREVNK